MARRPQRRTRSKAAADKRSIQTRSGRAATPTVFRPASARQIALSLKRSAEKDRRRRTTPYQTAMAKLTAYINRAGKNLSVARRRVLGAARAELRRMFDRP